MPLLFRKRATVKFSTLRSLSTCRKALLVKSFWAFANKKFETGELTPVVDRVMSWKRVGEAHGLLEKNSNFGKVVLAVDD